jgi:hypothetical protein
VVEVEVETGGREVFLFVRYNSFRGAWGFS